MQLNQINPTTQENRYSTIFVFNISRSCHLGTWAVWWWCQLPLNYPWNLKHKQKSCSFLKNLKAWLIHLHWQLSRSLSQMVCLFFILYNQLDGSVIELWGKKGWSFLKLLLYTMDYSKHPPSFWTPSAPPPAPLKINFLNLLGSRTVNESRVNSL